LNQSERYNKASLKLAAALGLKPGRPVWAQIEAVALIGSFSRGPAAPPSPGRR